MSMEEFEEWMYGEMGWSDTTIKKTLQKLRYIKKIGLNVERFDKMSEEKIRKELTKFFANLRKNGIRRKTINGYIKVINRYINYLNLNYKIKYFPDYSEEQISVPTDEEARRILAIRWMHIDTDSRNRAMIHLVFATGIRLSELVNLNWQDLDTMRRRLKIRAGKFEKDREIPIPAKVMKLLQQYRNVRTPSDQNAMFTTPSGRITEAQVRKIFKEAGKKAGVPGFHIHAARHWRAIKWINEGIDLDAVRILLGHKSIKSTQIYLRKRPTEEIYKQVEKKDTTFGPYNYKQKVIK